MPGRTAPRPTRIIVEASAYDAFLEKLIQKTKSITFGEPDDKPGPVRRAE
ncbi:Uncharacterised protein [Cedecea neteri]|uniref:Aldehyde dehydrogenase domain-containing protein n=1 Tax=Cedecea neteri TaxID=158822 RepID=A0A2X3IZA1_9ENTR|nr:Uncharacterised protein [Cedecea neteri]